MRRPMFAAAMAFAVLAGPVRAQTPVPEPATERVVFDATIMALPGPNEGPCMRLEAGRLSIRAALVGDVQPQRPHLLMSGYRGADPGASVALTIGRQESRATVALTGGTFYCWSVDVTAPDSPDPSTADLTSTAQVVSLKMTLAPAP